MGGKNSKSQPHCNVCRKEPACVFCLCRPRFILLCEQCVLDHRRGSLGYHYIIALDRLEEFRQNARPLPQQTLGPRRQLRAVTLNRSHLPLVRIEEGKLCMWKPSMQWKETPLQFPIKTTEWTRFVWMETTLFCTGCICYTGRGKWDGNWEIVCEIERNGAVAMLPRMLQPRKQRALLWHSATKQIFAFGGTPYLSKRIEMGKFRCNQGSHECEALSWYGTSWQALPNLPALPSSWDFYKVCEFHQYVYLSGSYKTSTIEVFDPLSRTFLRPLQICPFSWLNLLVVENNELVFLSDNCISRFEAGDGHGLVQLSQVQHMQTIYFSNQPPLVDSVNELLYYINSEKQVEFIELDGSSSTYFRLVNFG